MARLIEHGARAHFCANSASIMSAESCLAEFFHMVWGLPHPTPLGKEEAHGNVFGRHFANEITHICFTWDSTLKVPVEVSQTSLGPFVDSFPCVQFGQDSLEYEGIVLACLTLAQLGL